MEWSRRLIDIHFPHLSRLNQHHRYFCSRHTFSYACAYPPAGCLSFPTPVSAGCRSSSCQPRTLPPPLSLSSPSPVPIPILSEHSPALPHMCTAPACPGVVSEVRLPLRSPVAVRTHRSPEPPPVPPAPHPSLPTCLISTTPMPRRTASSYRTCRMSLRCPPAPLTAQSSTHSAFN